MSQYALLHTPNLIHLSTHFYTHQTPYIPVHTFTHTKPHTSQYALLYTANPTHPPLATEVKTDPMKFASKKSKVAAKKGPGATQWQILRSSGIPESEIPAFRWGMNPRVLARVAAVP